MFSVDNKNQDSNDDNKQTPIEPLSNDGAKVLTEYD